MPVGIHDAVQLMKGFESFFDPLFTFDAATQILYILWVLLPIAIQRAIDFFGVMSFALNLLC